MPRADFVGEGDVRHPPRDPVVVLYCFRINTLSLFEGLNLKTLVQERANYHFRHFWKNEVEVCEQKIAIITQLWYANMQILYCRVCYVITNLLINIIHLNYAN
jgi:hypothetical protein